MGYQIKPTQAVFDPATGFAKIAGWAEVYHYDSKTKEFTGVTYEFINEGVSVPANSCTDEPSPVENGKAIVRENNQWVYLNDYRGQTIYSKETLAESIQIEIGEISDEFTLLKPTSDFDRWNGKGWELDKQRKHQFYVEQATTKKADLIKEATDQINYFQDAIDTEIATEKEKMLYTEWKKYRALLNRIDVNQNSDITWPAKPE